VVAGSVAFLFDFGDPVEFVGIGFEVVEGVVEPGDGVETGAFGSASSDDGIGYADDRGRVHAAAEFGKHGSVGAEAALHGCCEGGAEVFLVFGVGAVADALAGIEVPIFAGDVLSRSEKHSRGRRDGVDADIGCQMRGGKMSREPAGDVLFAERESCSRKLNERIEDGAPRDLVFVDRVVQMARADEVLG